MVFYTNRTRHEAVLTIRVVAANDLKSSIKIGLPETLGSHEVTLGYNDLLVPAGESVDLADGTDVTFVSTRSAD